MHPDQSNASIKRLRLSTFKLNVLLDITQAINANPTIDELLKQYENILKEDLNIGKTTIFKFNGDKWECLLGEEPEITDHIDIEKDLYPLEDLTFVTAFDNPVLKAYDIVIPVINNNSRLAYVLIGDIEEEMEGMSPALKHLHFIQTLSNIILVAIENIRLFKESLRQEALKKELELASRMQTMLIPKAGELPNNEAIKVVAFYHPHFDVGGDYYDCIVMDKDEIGFCIADVSGKGISAALLMSNFQANLRALFTHEISLIALVEKLNERVLRSANGEKFITLFIAKYNNKRKELEFINAGHNPPLLYEVDDKNLIHLKKGCVGIGMLDEIPVINKGSITITQRTKLLLYTDGLVELIDDSSDVEFGTQAIEKDLGNTNGIESSIDDIIKSHKILEGSTAIFDDISMLGVEFF
ncbi:MAG: SpoIIE family protein phosphatase [Bacteroidales bacterium]|nr:SpoIIE family protein phosphatase [Bacteroidales bacterium]